MKFIVEGQMRIIGIWKPFIKEIEAISIARAQELCLQQLGADHRLKRTQIKIKNVQEMKP